MTTTPATRERALHSAARIQALAASPVADAARAVDDAVGLGQFVQQLEPAQACRGRRGCGQPHVDPSRACVLVPTGSRRSALPSAPP